MPEIGHASSWQTIHFWCAILQCSAEASRARWWDHKFFFGRGVAYGNGSPIIAVTKFKVPLKCSRHLLETWNIMKSLLVLASFSFEPFAIFAMTLLSSLVDGFWQFLETNSWRLRLAGRTLLWGLAFFIQLMVWRRLPGERGDPKKRRSYCYDLSFRSTW